MMEERINANIGKDKTYPIFISIDKISTIEAHLRDFTKANKFLIVISEKVNKLYGKELNFKNSIKYVLKDGEKEKNIKNYQKIMDFAIKNNLERKDCIIAIGGGVVGDIAGFVASTYLRGIDLIHIPTTLLACVDSSVGGKTGINTPKGKNLIGSFYQPKAVICNVNFIKTLDERQFKTGLAEVLKYAFIERNCQIDGTTNFLEYLAKHEKQVLERDIRTIALLVRISLSFKVFVVEQDERENGIRKILNFGHTYGHAIETITKYKKYTHGEAVAIGMLMIFKQAFDKGLIDEKYYNKATKLIKDFNIINKVPEYNNLKLIETMKKDKKIADGKINFVLPSAERFVQIFEVDFNNFN